LITQPLDYLHRIQQFELEPDMIHLRWSDQAQIWMAANFDRLNAILNQHLISCQDCFFPENRVSAIVFAAPINPQLRIDAFCNVRVDPQAIVVDVGRIVPADWLKVVAHEYAHAVVGSAGHSPRYASVLQHLCLGLGLDLLPLPWPGEEALQGWPHCRPTIDPIRFWQGTD
jgi:hypothetical protein